MCTHPLLKYTLIGFQLCNISPNFFIQKWRKAKNNCCFPTQKYISIAKIPYIHTKKQSNI